MRKATQVKPLEGYRIWLRYADGVEGEVDLSHLAGRGVFKSWSDRAVFESVHIDGSGAIAWPGDLDLCPDALYLRLTGKTADEVFPHGKTTLVDA
jgi:Protein of unknown function (DUF2442)